MVAKKVRAIGRDTYIRLCPNPGVGIRFFNRRLAISRFGGIEWFERHPTLVWRRTWSFMSAVKRPQ